MSYQVRLSANAEADLQSISKFIAQESPRRARTFVQELKQRFVRKLSTFPLSGVSEGKLRHTTFGNYGVIRTVSEDSKTVAIVMVTEGHRDWRRIPNV